MADHGNGGGDQSREWKQHETPFEREIDMGSIQTAHDGHQHQQFGPGFSRRLVQKTSFLQFFSQFCHWMCTHLHHQRTKRSHLGQQVEPKKVVFYSTPDMPIHTMLAANEFTRRTIASNDISSISDGRSTRHVSIKPFAGDHRCGPFHHNSTNPSACLNTKSASGFSSWTLLKSAIPPIQGSCSGNG